MNSDPLVRDYLARLGAAATSLSEARRTELEAEVAEHIEAALHAAGSRDEVTVRNVLERLGPPEEIAMAELLANESLQAPIAAPTPSAAEGRSPWGPVEILAILFLILGGLFVPFVGPFIGIALVWLSNQWTRREKAIATTVLVVLLIVPLLITVGLLAAGSSSGLSIGPVIQPIP